jgi:hypothetical protein
MSSEPVPGKTFLVPGLVVAGFSVLSRNVN